MPPRTGKPGYSHAAKSAVQETTQCVQEMHAAIAGRSFGLLRRMPLLAGPARIVESAHDAIAAGVYAAIRHGAGGLLDAAASVERQVVERRPAPVPGRLASALHSALNAAFGDHLAAAGNRLAIEMAIHVRGMPVALDPAALRGAFPDGGARLCLFIHGLACDERCWEAADAARECDFGRRLQAEFAYTPLYLRYNTGLPIADNGARLALLCEALLRAWPRAVDELVIVGHSMGGLVALAACEQATAAGLRWPSATRMLICLGSPNLGSPLERLGQLFTSALAVSNVTAPLARIAATRSQGIKDLRRGPGPARAPAAHPAIAFRFLGASLAADSAHPLGEWFGDGLVTPGSATAHGIGGDVRSARLGDIGHMALLNDARVYRQLREWLAAPAGKRRRRARPAPGA